MTVARRLVQGVDLWINTPRRPWEASGTSGMKVLVNGGLNLSELDGWWAEAYQPEVGWALGDGAEHGEDPAWDHTEAEALYRLLEQEVVAAFYERNARGLPQAWLARMRESMARLTGCFSTNRMVREYTETYYLPAAAAYRARRADECELIHEIQDWLAHTRQHWSQVHIAEARREHGGDRLHISARVYIDELGPDAVQVELYADPAEPGGAPERIPMRRDTALPGAGGAYDYQADIPARRPAEHYTVRVLPFHPDVQWPLETGLICWER
jgi:glycogen phosphorylase